MLKRWFFFLLFLLHLTHCPCKLQIFFWTGAPTLELWYHEEQLSILNPLLRDAKDIMGPSLLSSSCWKKLHEWCHFLCFADWSLWQETRPGHHGKVGFLPWITFMHWSGCNLDASCVFSVMRDFCKSPLNFCSFNIWKIIYLVFSNLPSCSFFPRLDCIFVQSSLQIVGSTFKHQLRNAGSSLVEI